MRRWDVSSPSLYPHPVISNTTPLISLVGVGLHDLLPAIYGEVWIPEAVYIEYQTGRVRHPGSPNLDTLPSTYATLDRCSFGSSLVTATDLFAASSPTFS